MPLATRIQCTRKELLPATFQSASQDSKPTQTRRISTSHLAFVSRPVHYRLASPYPFDGHRSFSSFRVPPATSFRSSLGRSRQSARRTALTLTLCRAVLRRAAFAPPRRPGVGPRPSGRPCVRVLAGPPGVFAQVRRQRRPPAAALRGRRRAARRRLGGWGPVGGCRVQGGVQLAHPCRGGRPGGVTEWTPTRTPLRPGGVWPVPSPAWGVPAQGVPARCAW